MSERLLLDGLETKEASLVEVMTELEAWKRKLLTSKFAQKQFPWYKTQESLRQPPRWSKPNATTCVSWPQTRLFFFCRLHIGPVEV
jgi:hypothetical protein